MGVSKEEFRTALGHFASSVTVVTARRGDEILGMTVSAFSSLSLTPPLILICVEKIATLHPKLNQGEYFAVNILSEDQEMISRRFATKDPGRFDGMGYSHGVTGSPLLDGALAHLECRIVDIYPGGDHSIVVGEVESTSISEGRPLTYYRGGYARLA